MSASTELQAAIWARLVSDPGVAAIVAGRVHDRPPASVAAPFLSFGPSDIVPDDADCIAGRIEALQIDAWSEAQDGFREVKALADAVKSALHGWTADLPTQAMIGCEVTAIRVMRDPDGLSSHAAITVEAMMEER